MVILFHYSTLRCWSTRWSLDIAEPKPREYGMCDTAISTDSIPTEGSGAFRLRGMMARGLRRLAGLAVADVFVGPISRARCLPEQSLICVANHTWCLDLITTLLSTNALGRDYSVLGSKRVASLLGPLKGGFGIVPMSGSPFENIQRIRTTLQDHGHKLALWIFPQGVWIPPTWDTARSVSTQAAKMIGILNRAVPILPVHIEVLVVRQLRPAVVITLGEVISPSAAPDRGIAETMSNLRAEATARLRSDCCEYRSIMHPDGFLFCGYPIRKQEIALFARHLPQITNLDIQPTPQGWTINIGCRNPMREESIAAIIGQQLPGVTGPNFLRHATLRVLPMKKTAYDERPDIMRDKEVRR